MNITDEAVFPVLGVLATLGTLHCLAHRRFLLPSWVLLIMILQSRDPRQESIIPVALLAGIGLDRVLLPLLGEARSQSPQGTRTLWRVIGFEGEINHLQGGVLCFIVLFAAFWGMIGYRPLLTGLSSEERQAMEWIARSTQERSQFLIVTGVPGGDRSFEWFPALTGRANAAPIQGYEWVEGFNRRVAQDMTLQRCALRDSSCIDEWSEKAQISFTHIYVPKRAAAPLFAPIAAFGQSKDCCAALRSSLQRDSRYVVVYDGPGASVFERAATGRLE
jgi:hypothetical protein